jgi:hypothetical protein
MKKIIFIVLALSFSICACAQITMKGTVTNDSIPLESASVIIKNSTKGIATNTKGQFKIKAKKGDTLSISYLGYETKEFVVNEDGILGIQLQEGGQLNEVVVNAYGHGRKISCGVCYSVTQCGVCSEGTKESKGFLGKEKLKFYPNPSSNGIFQLNLNKVYDEIGVLITNISGQAIHNSNYKKDGKKLTIDLSQAAIGIYIINVTVHGRRLEVFKAIRS